MLLLFDIELIFFPIFLFTGGESSGSQPFLLMTHLTTSKMLITSRGYI